MRIKFRNFSLIISSGSRLLLSSHMKRQMPILRQCHYRQHSTSMFWKSFQVFHESKLRKILNTYASRTLWPHVQSLFSTFSHWHSYRCPVRACDQRAIVCNSFSFHFDQSMLYFGIRLLFFGFCFLLVCSFVHASSSPFYVICFHHLNRRTNSIHLILLICS